MPIDYSINNWINTVATRQWTREGEILKELGDQLPEIIATSRPLSEVHRLDLALFVVFEEAALRVSGILTRLAPNLEALKFSAEQTIDEARHYEIFHDRLNLTCAKTQFAGGNPTDAILIPPLRRFLDHCYEVADGGSFIEGMVLMNLVLEGMAYPLYSYEERYWKPVDPFLARLIRSAFNDETRHISFGANIVRTLLKDDPTKRAKTIKVFEQSCLVMNEIFEYYVRKFVGIFDAVAKRHSEYFAEAEFLPGKLISQTPYEEQVSIIQASIKQEHSKLVAKAGLN